MVMVVAMTQGKNGANGTDWNGFGRGPGGKPLMSPLQLKMLPPN